LVVNQILFWESESNVRLGEEEKRERMKNIQTHWKHASVRVTEVFGLKKKMLHGPLFHYLPPFDHVRCRFSVSSRTMFTCYFYTLEELYMKHPHEIRGI